MRNSDASTLRPVVICPYLCTSDNSVYPTPIGNRQPEVMKMIIVAVVIIIIIILVITTITIAIAIAIATSDRAARSLRDRPLDAASKIWR